MFCVAVTLGRRFSRLICAGLINKAGVRAAQTPRDPPSARPLASLNASYARISDGGTELDQ